MFLQTHKLLNTGAEANQLEGWCLCALCAMADHQKLSIQTRRIC